MLLKSQCEGVKRLATVRAVQVLGMFSPRWLGLRFSWIG